MKPILMALLTFSLWLTMQACKSATTAPSAQTDSNNNQAPYSNSESVSPDGTSETSAREIRSDSNTNKSAVGAMMAGGVLNDKALEMPQPAYPATAKAARASGKVSVRVIVDERGRVISAQAENGHPLLRQAAVEAARQARFTPRLFSGTPIKVEGVLAYDFAPE